MIRPLIILALIAVLSFQGSEAVTCYKCEYSDGDQSNKCGDPFGGPDGVPTEDCSGRCQKTKIMSTSSYSVSRGCSSSCQELEIGNSHVKCCDGDKCNSGRALSSAPWMTSLALVLVAVVVYNH